MSDKIYCTNCKSYVLPKDYNKALGICNSCVREAEERLREHKEKKK